MPLVTLWSSFPADGWPGLRTREATLLPFGAAKQEAIRLYKRRDEAPLDWIRELLTYVPRESRPGSPGKEKRRVPFDLMGRGKRWLNPVRLDREVIRNIIEVETCKPLREEDTQRPTPKGGNDLIQCDADGSPELPACLDRCKPRLRQAA